MDKRKPTLLLSRRELIKSASLLTGLFLTNTLHPPIHAQGKTTPLLSVSLLIPPSFNQFVEPLRHGMNTYQVGVNRISEINVRNTSAIENLLKHHSSDAVVIFASDFFAKRLQPLFDAYQVPLIVVNLGEDQHTSPAYHQTLGLWQANQALGRWTGENLGGDAIIMSSIYDSGYDALDAFHQSFSQSGGNIREFILRDADQIDWDHLPDDLSVIYASYSGKQAELFWDGYNHSPVSHIPVAVSPFTLFDGQGNIHTNAHNAFTITTWGRDVQPFFQLGTNIGRALRLETQINPEHSHTFTYLAVDDDYHVHHHPITHQSVIAQEADAVKVGWVDPFLV